MPITLHNTFIQSTQNVNSNFTTVANTNYLAVGPITIDTGITLTITANSTLAVV